MNIPEDFPRDSVIASVSGVHPKVLVRLDSISGVYAEGPIATEVEERYDMCLDLVTQLVDKCMTNRNTKYAALSEVQILERLLASLLGTRWGSVAEMRWVIRQVALRMDWKIPDSATGLKTMLGQIA